MLRTVKPLLSNQTYRLAPQCRIMPSKVSPEMIAPKFAKQRVLLSEIKKILRAAQALVEAIELEVKK